MAIMLAGWRSDFVMHGLVSKIAYRSTGNLLDMSRAQPTCVSLSRRATKNMQASRDIPKGPCTQDMWRLGVGRYIVL